MTQTARKELSPDVVGLELAPTQFSYEERDTMLYALGIGAKELEFIFERGLKAIPTFAVIPAFPALMGLSAAVEINPVMILHGEQGFRISKEIPTSGTLTTSGKVTGVYDKGKGALVTIDSTTTDAGGELVFTNTSGIFIRGAGGFGGERGPEAGNVAPERAPDKSVEMPTLRHPGGDLPPLRRPQPAAHRPRRSRRWPATTARSSTACAASATPAAPSSRSTAGTTPAASSACPSASPASSTRATRSSRRCGTRAAARSSFSPARRTTGR